jgi:hypothetical protein
MRSVITIPTTNDNEVVESNRVSLTHRKTTHGWIAVNLNQYEIYLAECEKLVYLGKCSEDGDMFALYIGRYIMIFRGYLNSGMY